MVAGCVRRRGSQREDLRRPALQQLLEQIGPGDILVVAKLDRLSRSLIDFVDLMQVAGRQGWQIVALDLGVDTTTPAVQMLANVMASFAQYERQLIGERPRVALAAKRAAGHKLGGSRLIPSGVADTILIARAGGMSLRAIAGHLNTSGVSTARGGQRWYPSTVSAVLKYADGDKHVALRVGVRPNERSHGTGWIASECAGDHGAVSDR